MLNALSVPFNRELEVSNSVLGQRVGPALQHDHIRTVGADHDVGYLLENIQIIGIIDALADRHVDAVEFPDPLACRLQLPCAWEEVFLVLVEAESHDSICMVECFFDSIAMVDIDVDVDHAGVDFEELQDADHNIIDVTKADFLCILS